MKPMACNPFKSCFTPDVSKKQATIYANIVLVTQEFVAVVFHLVCLSRLEATADIKSNLVLFLTLVVFTGPYLNAWLVFVEYMTIKRWDDYAYMLGNVLMGLAITLAHVVGSLVAWGCVLAMQPPSNGIIVWNKQNSIHPNATETEANKKDAMWKNDNWHVHLIEETFAVASLLIGFIYLLWLVQWRKVKSTAKTGQKQQSKPKGVKIDIKFYFQLTLLVAAVAQAFPSAQLSPHVLCYKVLMQTITLPQFLSRLGGGGIGLFIASVWCRLRNMYKESIQTKVDPEHDHNAHDYDPLQNMPDSRILFTPNSGPSTNKGQMPAIRLSMYGGSYY